MKEAEAEAEAEAEERSLRWMLLDYILVWPFMCHVGLVLAVAWAAAWLHINVAFISLLGFIYLYQIEGRQRAKLLRQIRHEEKQKASKMRLAEGETVRWMNEAVKSIWPICLENFASQMLLLPLSPWFLNTYKPWTARKAIVQHLCLGKTPPVITMIRVLEQPSDGDDLAIEAAMEFVAAKDMSAVLAVQVRRRMSGLWTSFHISNLHLEGKVKIGIKFVNGWPVIGRLRFCFATAPFVQITARPLFNYGVDVAELPGIAQWLDRLMAEALEQSLVEPNMLEIDCEKLLKDILGPQGGATPHPKPADWFIMHERPPVAEVVVEVLEATGLRVADLNGFSDPFVKGTLGGKKFMTKVKWKTLNPKWDETFTLPIVSWEFPNTLLMSVRDKDRFYDDYLGLCVIDVNEYRDGNRHYLKLPLKHVNTGEIHVAIKVIEKRKDSQSPDETPNDSTTFATISQPLSQELPGKVPAGAVPAPASPGGGSIPAGIERLLSQAGKPAPAESSKDARSGSSFFGSRSLQRNELVVDTGSGKPQNAPGGDISPIGTSGEISRVAAAASSTRLEPEVKIQPGGESARVIDVGIGELGAVSICQHDVEPTKWPSQKLAGEKGVEEALLKLDGAGDKVSHKSVPDPEGLTNIEEDGGAARKIRSAGLAVHGMFHRHRKEPEKDVAKTSSPSGTGSHEHIQFATEHAAQNGTLVHLTMEPLAGGGHPPGEAAPAGLLPRHDPQGSDQGGDALDGDSGEGGADPDRHPLRTRTKGLMNMAGNMASHMGHQLNKRMRSRKHMGKDGGRPLSPDERTSSGELTPTGHPVPPTSQVAELKGDEKSPRAGRLGKASPPAATDLAPVRAEARAPELGAPSGTEQPPPGAPSHPSEPPSRAPPGLPQPVAPNPVQTDAVTSPRAPVGGEPNSQL